MILYASFCCIIINDGDDVHDDDGADVPPESVLDDVNRVLYSPLIFEVLHSMEHTL
jgi:hypothetical protein